MDVTTRQKSIEEELDELGLGEAGRAHAAAPLAKASPPPRRGSAAEPALELHEHPAAASPSPSPVPSPVSSSPGLSFQEYEQYAGTVRKGRIGVVIAPSGEGYGPRPLSASVARRAKRVGRTTFALGIISLVFSLASLAAGIASGMMNTQLSVGLGFSQMLSLSCCFLDVLLHMGIVSASFCGTLTGGWLFMDTTTESVDRRFDLARAFGLATILGTVLFGGAIFFRALPILWGFVHHSAAQMAFGISAVVISGIVGCVLLGSLMAAAGFAMRAAQAGLAAERQPIKASEDIELQPSAFAQA